MQNEPESSQPFRNLVGPPRSSRVSGLLEPVILTERIRQGLNALLGLLDASAHHRPHWAIGLKEGDLQPFQEHGPWDLCHDVARALHAIGMAEQATGEKVEDAIWQDLAEQQFALFEAGDDLPGTVDPATGRYWVHLHNIREAVHGLAALMRRGDARAEALCRAMVRVLGALDDTEALQLHRLPAYIEPYTWQPHQEGRAVDALVRYYRQSGDEAALELAQLLARRALETCFGLEGSIRETAGTHGQTTTPNASCGGTCCRLRCWT